VKINGVQELRSVYNCETASISS